MHLVNSFMVKKEILSPVGFLNFFIHLFLFAFIFEAGSHVIQGGLELTMWLRMVLHF